jgi:hypothetical protein
MAINEPEPPAVAAKRAEAARSKPYVAPAPQPRPPAYQRVTETPQEKQRRITTVRAKAGVSEPEDFTPEGIQRRQKELDRLKTDIKNQPPDTKFTANGKTVNKTEALRLVEENKQHIVEAAFAKDFNARTEDGKIMLFATNENTVSMLPTQHDRDVMLAGIAAGKDFVNHLIRGDDIIQTAETILGIFLALGGGDYRVLVEYRNQYLGYQKAGDKAGMEHAYNNMLVRATRLKISQQGFNLGTYILSQPTTQLAIMYGVSTGIGVAGGFLKSVSPVAYKAYNLGMTGYTVGTTISSAKEGVKLYQEKGISAAGSHVAQLGISLFGSASGYRIGFKVGEKTGFRSLLIAKAKTPMYRAYLKDMYTTLKIGEKLSSRVRRPLQLTEVTSLKGKPEQITALQKAMTSKEMKKYKLVLGGSAAQTTYFKQGVLRAPKDIDIGVKQGWKRPTIKKVGEKGKGLELGWERPSRVEAVKVILKKYGVDISKKAGIIDIHDLSVPGSPFTQKGGGYTKVPIRTAKGSIFKWQEPLGEQFGKKTISAVSPLHSMRGKDWMDVISIAENKFSTRLKTTREVTPKQYAKNLAKQGKIKVKEKLPLGELKKRNVFGMAKTTTPWKPYSIRQKPEIIIDATLSVINKGVTKQQVYAHELAHAEPYIKYGYMAKEPYAYKMEAMYLKGKVKYNIPSLLERVKKWQPELKEGTHELIGKSYYQLHPSEAPTAKLTIGQRFLRKYGANIIPQEGYFTEGIQFKPQQSGQPFRVPVDIAPPTRLSRFASKLTMPKNIDIMFLSETGASVASKIVEKTGPIFPYPKGYTAKTPEIKYDYQAYINKFKEAYNVPKISIEKYPVQAKISYPTHSHLTRYYSPPQKTGYPSRPSKPYGYYNKSEPTKPIPRRQTTLEEEPEKEKERKQGYNAYVKKDATKKEKARWVKVNPQPLTEQQAFGIGARATDETVSRSFKIAKSNSRAVPNPKYDSVWPQLSHKFRKPVRKGTSPVWIEKSAFAIDTPGEFQGITVKGWVAAQSAAKMRKKGQIHAPGRKTNKKIYNVWGV